MDSIHDISENIAELQICLLSIQESSQADGDIRRKIRVGFDILDKICCQLDLE